MITWNEAAANVPAVTINFGVFVNTLLNSIILAFAIFMVIKGLNKMKKKEEPKPAAPTTKECAGCFNEISIKATCNPNCASELSA